MAQKADTRTPTPVAVNGKSVNTPIKVKAEAPPDFVDTHHGAILSALFSEPDLMEALSKCEAPKFVNFLAALANPLIRTGNKANNRMRDLIDIARDYLITPTELEMLWRNHTLSKAMVNVVKYMPRIAEDLARDSLSTEIACPRCDGWGDVMRKVGDQTEKMACPQCKGAMVIRKDGNPDARKLLLETIGWAGKNQTFINNGVVQNNASGGVLDELDQIEKKRLPLATTIIEAETEDVKP